MVSRAPRKQKAAASRPTNGRRDKKVVFEESDFSVLDLTLDQNPELRICAAVVKAARKSSVRYPIESASPLSGLLPRPGLFLEGHRLDREHVHRYLPKDFFPIRDERELIARCYVGLMRCKNEMAWAMRAPENATAILNELHQTIVRGREDAHGRR